MLKPLVAALNAAGVEIRKSPRTPGTKPSK